MQRTVVATTCAGGNEMENNPQRQLAVPEPEPLSTCPGRQFWQHFRGKPYLVFVDESFRGFFEFDRRGYFVHGTVGIPEERYSDVQREVVPTFEDFRRLTSAGAKEFKYSEFRRIKAKDRRRLAFRIRDTLKANGAFIGGFYSPLESVVLERARTNLFLKGEHELPVDRSEVYAEAEAELRAESDGPGQSAIVAKLLTLPIVGVANMLASLDSKFTVVYDPREKREDRAVKATIEGYLKLFENLKGLKTDLRSDLNDYFVSFLHDKRSEDEIGLQLADLVAGEIREFFAVNPELLQYKASPVLITPTSREPLVTVTEVRGVVFKTGALNRMTTALQRRFFRQDAERRTVLPIYRDLLAAGILTCYSSEGQPRDLMPFEAVVWDQLE